MNKLYSCIFLFIIFLTPSVFAGSESVTDQPAGGIPINDNSCFDRTLTISTTETISNVKIKIDLSHTYRGDLDITLTSPQSTSVDLTSDNGGNSDNLSVIFDDDAAESITSDNSDHTLGTFLPRQPEGSLSSFDGDNPQGDWTLRICDDAGADTGTYNESTLIVKWETDTDGDGVYDSTDVDDDNDGILDVNESLIDISDFKLNGDATELSATEIQLTAATNNQFGTAMSLRTVDLNNSFTIDAEIYLGTNDGGADGMAFVLHNDPRGSDAYGNGEGSTLGAMANGSVAGIANGLSFEFDTYQSSSGSDDPSNDHTQIRDTDEAFNDTAGRVTTVTSLNNLEDGNWHTFHLDWDADDSQFKYWIDGVEMTGLIDANMASNYFGGSTQVYFGFTAATGGLNNVQKIQNVSSTQLKDSDGDGIFNSFDLDSDNDGIADNVEAQSTGGFIFSGSTSTPPTVRADGSNDAYPATGLTLIDTDGDGIFDNLDNDSDADLISDCSEGYVGLVVDCANLSIRPNGMDVNAGPGGYDQPSGFVSDPDPDNGTGDLDDEISGNDEAAYREAACGPSESNLTAYQWKTISFPCNTGSNSIDTLLSDSLGTYGDNDNWVMYRQLGNYTGNRNTDMQLMASTDTVEPGKGYWIIADADKTAKIKRPLADINITATVVPDAATYPGVPTSGAAFDEIFPYDLPDSIDTDFRKVLIGNPFFKTYKLSNVYYKYDTNDYVSTADLTAGSSSMEPIVYIKDSADTTTGNYVAIDPGSTPGFGDTVPVMQGYWIKLNAYNPAINKITFPFEQ